jgi:hypothetical protein
VRMLPPRGCCRSDWPRRRMPHNHDRPVLPSVAQASGITCHQIDAFWGVVTNKERLYDKCTAFQVRTHSRFPRRPVEGRARGPGPAQLRHEQVCGQQPAAG